MGRKWAVPIALRMVDCAERALGLDPSSVDDLPYWWHDGRLRRIDQAVRKVPLGAFPRWDALDVHTVVEALADPVTVGSLVPRTPAVLAMHPNGWVREHALCWLIRREMCFEVVALRTTDWIPVISDAALTACYEALEPFRRGRDVIDAAPLFRTDYLRRRQPHLATAVERYLLAWEESLRAWRPHAM